MKTKKDYHAPRIEEISVLGSCAVLDTSGGAGGQVDVLPGFGGVVEDPDFIEG